MKTLFNALAIALASILFFSVAEASVDWIQIPSGTSHKVLEPGKVVAIQVLSEEASGTATVKAEEKLVRIVDDVTTTAFTNFTYSLVYSNGTEVVTNTTAVDYSPTFPPSLRYIEYFTNTIVTTTTTTNKVPSAVLTVTNDVGTTVTCSGGYGKANPSDAYLAPGSTVFAEGTANGRVTLIIER